MLACLLCWRPSRWPPWSARGLSATRANLVGDGLFDGGTYKVKHDGKLKILQEPLTNGRIAETHPIGPDRTDCRQFRPPEGHCPGEMDDSGTGLKSPSSTLPSLWVKMCRATHVLVRRRYGPGTEYGSQAYVAGIHDRSAMERRWKTESCCADDPRRSVQRRGGDTAIGRASGFAYRSGYGVLPISAVKISGSLSNPRTIL